MTFVEKQSLESLRREITVESYARKLIMKGWPEWAAYEWASQHVIERKSNDGREKIEDQRRITR